MYQIRHHEHTNLVLCKDDAGRFLHWQDEVMLSDMPAVTIVQATTVEELAETFTVLTLHFTICHDEVCIMHDGTVVPMTVKDWKKFDARVQARVIGKQLNMDFEELLVAFRDRGAYLEERDEQAQSDYLLAQRFHAIGPGSIMRLNRCGERHMKYLAAQRQVLPPGAELRTPPSTEPASDDGTLTDDPKYMYGVKLPFWKEVLVTVGLGALISNIGKE